MPRMLQLHRFDGPDGLQIDDLPLREPGPGEIRIANEAFALNYGDLGVMTNAYVFDVQLPTPIGDEAAGVVDAIGEGVDTHEVGDRVSTLPFINTGYMASGESVVVPAEFAVPYPQHLSAAEGCSIWVQYLTAYYALLELSSLTKEDWVLVTAGASSAGSAALEICRMQGVRTIATTRSEDQFDYLYEMGVTRAVVPNDTFDQQIRDITDNKGVNVAYDNVGDPLLAMYSRALATGALIILYGGLDSRPDIVPIIPMNQSAAILRSYSVYQHIYDAAQRSRGVSFVFDALVRGDLKPRVDKVFPLEDFKDAFDYQVEAKRRRGKIVLSMI